MLRTEDEARCHWCPHMEDQRDRCLASQCMAWRWYDAGIEDGSGETYRDGRYMGPTDRGWDRPGDPSSMRKRLPRRGYCGLAGTPA